MSTTESVDEKAGLRLAGLLNDLLDAATAADAASPDEEWLAVHLMQQALHEVERYNLMMSNRWHRIRDVERAVLDPGDNPSYHHQVVARMSTQWPTLMRSLNRLTYTRRGTFLDV